MIADGLTFIVIVLMTLKYAMKANSDCLLMNFIGKSLFFVYAREVISTDCIVFHYYSLH